jgi:hypothetical protein
VFEYLQLRGGRLGGSGVVPIFAEQADHDDERDERPKKAGYHEPNRGCTELDNGVSPTPEAISSYLAAKLGPQQLVDGDLAEAEVLLDAAAV